MISLRPAVRHDLPLIRELVHAAQINPTGLVWQRFIVVENEQGELVGCGQIKPHRDGSHELAALVVASAYRRQGIARTLVEHLTEIHQGPLYLMCRASLGKFYERFGFQAISKPEMPPYFRRINRLASLVEILQRDGETLLVMRKT